MKSQINRTTKRKSPIFIFVWKSSGSNHRRSKKRNISKVPPGSFSSAVMLVQVRQLRLEPAGLGHEVALGGRTKSASHPRPPHASHVPLRQGARRLQLVHMPHHFTSIHHICPPASITSPQRQRTQRKERLKRKGEEYNHYHAEQWRTLNALLSQTLPFLACSLLHTHPLLGRNNSQRLGGWNWGVVVSKAGAWPPRWPLGHQQTMCVELSNQATLALPSLTEALPLGGSSYSEPPDSGGPRVMSHCGLLTGTQKIVGMKQ